MQLECKVRLVTIFVRNSFKCPVPSNLYLGSRPRSPLDPVLVLVTSNSITEFQVANNVKRIYKKEENEGRIGVEFFTPPHQLLICSERTELAKFLELLNKLMDRRVMEMLEHIPTIRQVSRPVPKRVKIDLESCTESNLFEDASCRECKLHVIPQRIPDKLSHYLKEVDFPKCGLTEIPIELGRTSVERINFELNELGDTSFMWLEELPIRKSLKSLNLAENKIKIFPTVLIEFHSLISLNLRDNVVECIPSCIHQLRTLKYLNLSGNNLRYLPASFESMKLCEADLTYNLLTSNIRSDFKPEFRDDRKTCMRLVDIAALSIDPVLRRELSYEQYPRPLLESLRWISKCGGCDAITVPHSTSQSYIMLFTAKFALSCKIHPQKRDFSDVPLYGLRHKGNGIGNVFLQYHFCDKCKIEYAQYSPLKNDYMCYRLSLEEVT
ncbi:hypothetical protein V9T40_006702 [Parthenolecanium corni]|uniref:PIF1/LRR1 pleckstrin homology domain-containing protein n=1 Tax=Parthenolecanium corni TaxID=536013 RepID=A0AAN9TRD6_9HEMI